MKPSKFSTVIGKKALFLLPKFDCLTWKGYAYCSTQEKADKINSTEGIDSKLESHETMFGSGYAIFLLYLLMCMLHTISCQLK